MPFGIQHLITSSAEGKRTVTVFDPNDGTVTVHDDHPKFSEIVRIASEPQWDTLSRDTAIDEIKELADVRKVVERALQSLSHDVKVEGNRVLYRGEPVGGLIEDQILANLDDDRPRVWKRLVRFLEKLQQNPNEASREQLFSFLEEHGLVITAEGNFVAYKGTRGAPDYRSVHAGGGIVDGVKVDQVTNAIGSVVEYDREKVNSDSSVSCAEGLHVGSYDYAQGWSSGGFLTCSVDPADVVSVPVDSNAAKVRVSKYQVVDLAPTQAYEAFSSYPEDLSDDRYEDDECSCGCCG